MLIQAFKLGADKWKEKYQKLGQGFGKILAIIIYLVVGVRFSIAINADSHSILELDAQTVSEMENFNS